MAKKNSSKSSTRKTKKTPPPSRTGRSPARSRRTTSRATEKSSSKSSSKSTASQSSQPPRRISVDRWLDIAGIILALIGLLTLLSLISANRSSVTGTWITWLNTAFGWGTYILPLALIGVGLWLVLRHFERIPWPSFERILGYILLFLNIVTWLHFFLQTESTDASFAAADAGRGGGYIGAGLSELLLASLGKLGAAIVLIAWLIIALALTLDRSILSLFEWTSPIVDTTRSFFQQLKSKLSTSFIKTPLPAPAEAPEIYPIPSADQPEVSPSTAQLSTNQETFMVSAEPNIEWRLPKTSEVLDAGLEAIRDDEVDRQRVHIIEDTLASFGAPAHVVEINRGPTITQYGVEPDYIETRNGRTRVRVSKIASLADDMALALAAKRIRIQAPVPGKGYIGIEVPNEEPNLVTLRDVLESDAFKRLNSPLRFALGQDVAGNAVAADLAAMPHLLIAGATGSGKSVCVNSVITGLLVNNTPDDLRILMVDPKRVELTGYNYIPHLLAPVVVELERVVGALQWIAREMDQRYHKFARAGARNIADYNAKQIAQGEKKVPYIVVVVDELADLMMLAPDETERNITRLAQLARATGIHLIIATQRPSVDVVTGLIKANFPARVAFAVASGTDSRVILDQPGAERLLGSGDMLFQAPDAPAPVRLQGVFVSDIEIHRVVTHWLAQAGVSATTQPLNQDIVDSLPSGIPLKQIAMWEEFEPEEEKDPLWNEALDLIRRQGRASISMLQRRLRIGYTRAARLVEEMEAKGIVGPPEGGAGTREVLDYGDIGPPVDPT